MGLDMYLHATRTFAPDSPEADKILSAAGVTLNDLKAKSGLDPYEYETAQYLSMWDFYSDDDKRKATEVFDIAGLLPFTTKDSPAGYLGYQDEQVSVQITCIYWRKANAVHAWFVDNCQDGVDECQESPVHVEQLAALRSTCGKALAAYEAGDLATARDTMTPRDGFFFGGTDLDDWWAEDMRRTISEIERVVQQAIEVGGVEFSYQSSW